MYNKNIYIYYIVSYHTKRCVSINKYFMQGYTDSIHLYPSNHVNPSRHLAHFRILNRVHVLGMLGFRTSGKQHKKKVGYFVATIVYTTQKAANSFLLQLWHSWQTCTISKIIIHNNNNNKNHHMCAEYLIVLLHKMLVTLFHQKRNPINIIKPMTD